MNGGSFISKMMNFDSMIGPTLIKVIYFIGLIGYGIFGLLMLLGCLSMMMYNPAYGLLGIILVPIIVMFCMIMWRFACESWILLFKIHDRLGEIKDKLPG